MEGILLPICSCVFSFLLFVVYFSKERIDLVENKIYSKMLILSFIDGILVTIVQGLALNGVVSSELLIISIINKIDFIVLIYYTGCIFYYTLLVTILNYKGKKTPIYYIMHIVNIVAVVAIFFTDVEVINSGSNYSISGMASIITYLVCGLHLLCSIFTVIIFHKKRDVRHIPIYAIIIIIAVLFVLFKLNPYLIVISITLTFINYLMFFTIENPDVKMLNQMELAKNEAEKANSAKTDFLSSMSHEIRTPLNAIVGFSECIKNTDDINEAHEDAEDVIKASKTLLEIVNGILDISKIESGKLEIINSPYDSKELLNQVAKLIKPKMEEKALDFKVSIADDIPKTLYGDHANIKKIITNLLSNAAKYTEKGFVKYEVRCINNKNVCRLVISIEDSGRGIKEENMNKLFTKFQRLEEDKNTTLEGTGLGLAITKQLVELMGGKIVVQSVYGSGSKFTIILDQRIEKVEIKEEKKDLNIKIDLTGKKILIVDDNLINIKVASKLLEKYHPTIDTCDNGYTCIEKIKNNEKYDLILLDDMMPKLSGVETLKELKSINGFNITTIALTANAITGMREKYLNDGFDNYLAKPINKEELKELLIKYLVNNDKTIDFGELPKEIYEIGNTDEIDIDQPVNSKNEEIEYEQQEENENKKETQTSSIDYLKENHIDIDKSISLLGDIDTYNDTLKDFLNNISNRIKKLSEYKDNDDMENYSIEIHSLKSDSKYLGFTALAGICFEQEIKSKENNIKYIKDDYSKLIKELDKMIDISNKYLNM